MNRKMALGYIRQMRSVYYAARYFHRYAIGAALVAGLIVLASHAALVAPMRAVLTPAPYQNFIGIALISALQLTMMVVIAIVCARAGLFERKWGLVWLQPFLLLAAAALEAVDIAQFIARHSIPVSQVTWTSFVMHAMRLYAVFGIWSGIMFVLMNYALLSEQRRSAAEARAAARDFEIAALRHQIEPHFLFNALSTLHALVDEGDKVRSVQMIEAMSRVFRKLLRHSSSDRQSLREEFEFTRSYLDIMKHRFADTLSVTLKLPDELAACEAPALILQPLAENAIKHARSARESALSITIAAHRRGEALVLSVTDDGPGFADISKRGVGLTNITERIRLMYGDQGSLEIGQSASGGAEVCVVYPTREHA